MIKVIDFLVGGLQVDFIYNQNTPTTQAKKSMKSGRFLGGGAPVRFYVNGFRTPTGAN